MNQIRFAEMRDLPVLAGYDRHVDQNELAALIPQKRVIIMSNENDLLGWLRYNLFWDSIPFMNMLYFREGFRGQGNGGKLVGFWEAEMRGMGHDMVMTSSQADEQGQFFYRKHGYIDCGSLLLPGEPLEIIFMKKL